MLLDADRGDEIVQLSVALDKEVQLIVEMVVDGFLDGGSAYPDRAAAHEGGGEAKQLAADAPQRHDPAWASEARVHRGAEFGAVFGLVTEHFAQGCDDVG